MPEERRDISEELKDYLLGLTADEETLEKTEERLLTDEGFFEALRIREEELVQDYADGLLSEEERKGFERHYLISEDRKRKLDFARSLRKHVDRRTEEPDPVEEASEKPSKRGLLERLSGLFSSPLPVAAAALLIIGVGVFSVWNLYWRPSDSEIALASLNRAYQNERPLELRISGFEYAPKRTTRGGEPSDAERIHLERAESIVLKNAADDPTAENLHVLGRYYLTKRDFEGAARALRRALAAGGSDKKEIHNDLGVALLERSREAENPSERFDLLGESLENLGKALGSDPEFLPAVFNRALVLEERSLPNQAREQWERYLQLDPDSEWAGEVRRRLRKTGSENRRPPDQRQLEERFVKASKEKNEPEAFRLAGLDRNLVKQKYLPQKFASSITRAEPDARKVHVDALVYLGEMEKRRLGDEFAEDLGDLYRQASPGQLSVLRDAHRRMERGYELCLQNDFAGAGEEFSRATELYKTGGNKIEANTVAKILLAYSILQTGQARRAFDMFREVERFTKERNYRWLHLLSRYWSWGASLDLGLRSYTESIRELREQLADAEETDDLYLTTTLLIELILQNRYIRNERRLKINLARLFELASTPDMGLRQKARIYGVATQTLRSTEFSELLGSVMEEGMRAAGNTEDKQILINFRINNGIVHARRGDLSSAERSFEEAAGEIRSGIGNEPVRNALLGKTYLLLGKLETERGSFEKALAHYEKAAAFSEFLPPLQNFELKRSRLLLDYELERFEGIDERIEEVIGSAEKYRGEILFAHERNMFFGRDRGIYDIAVRNELRKGRPEKAYAYAETSTSRALLDWLEKGISVIGADKRTGVLLKGTGTSLELEQIRDRLPPDTQIVQYSVLDDRLLIWAYDKNRFDVAEVPLDPSELRGDIDAYLSAIRRNRDPDERTRLAGKLYEALIEPVADHLAPSETVCLIPSKFLFRVPFASLIGPDDEYLITKHDISYSPSASLFIRSVENSKGTKERKSRAGETILAVGNPAFDRQLFERLEDLPEAEREARTVADLYPGTSKTLVGAEATRQNFFTHAGSAEIIHFAGHYLVKNGLPLDSGLVLARGRGPDERADLLTNADLVNEKFPETKMIVLSACNTGSEGYPDSEGLTGLSKTFLAAGIPTVVGSLWKVDSEATAKLMTAFHRHRVRKKVSPSEALRLAQLEMIGSEDAQHRDPFYWSAFNVTGGF